MATMARSAGRSERTSVVGRAPGCRTARAAPACAAAGPATGSVPTRPRLEPVADGQVLGHRQVGEHGRVLVDEVQAQGAGLRRGGVVGPISVPSTSMVPPGSACVHAGHDLDEGGLARPVAARRGRGSGPGGRRTRRRRSARVPGKVLERCCHPQRRPLRWRRRRRAGLPARRRSTCAELIARSRSSAHAPRLPCTRP